MRVLHGRFVVDNETKNDLAFQLCRHRGPRSTSWVVTNRLGSPSVAESVDHALAPPGADHRRDAGLPGPTRHGQDHRGRHRPPGRGVAGHRLPGLPRRSRRDPRRRGGHRDGPAVLRPRRPDGGRPRPHRSPGRGHRRGLCSHPEPCRAGLPGGQRAGDGARAPGLRRVRPAADHGLPVHRSLPGPMDDSGRGRARGRVGHPHRAVLRHRPVTPWRPGRPDRRPASRLDVHDPRDRGPPRRRSRRLDPHHPVRARDADRLTGDRHSSDRSITDYHPIHSTSTERAKGDKP